MVIYFYFYWCWALQHYSNFLIHYQTDSAWPCALAKNKKKFYNPIGFIIEALTENIFLKVVCFTLTCLRILKRERLEQDMYFGVPLVLNAGEQPNRHLKWDISLPGTGPIYSNIVLGTATGFLTLPVKGSFSLKNYDCHCHWKYSELGLLGYYTMTKSYNLQWAGYIIRFIATTITISSTSIITFRLMMFNGSCLTSSFHGSFQIKIEKMCYVYIMSSYCFFYPLSLAIAKIATVEIH